MKKIISLFLFISTYTYGAVTFEELKEVEQALYKTFNILKSDTREVLSINKAIPGISPTYWWDIDMIHASYVNVTDEQKIEHNIYLMGGFARLPGMTPDGLLITGCHEMGHGIGGEPRKELSGMSDFRSSTEGQSDYFATRFCLPIALSFLRPLRVIKNAEIYNKICQEQTLHEISLCVRMLNALESDIYYFKYSGHDVSIENFSSHVQESLNLNPTYYPDPQCRLDTTINGILGLERPECWFPGGEIGGRGREFEF